jgi:hypothetical protein
MAQFLRKSVVADGRQFVRRYVPCSALALCCLATSVTAGERFGQWSLEFQQEGVVTLKLKPSVSPSGGFQAPEVAFVCNQESKYVVVIVAPSPGTFQNQQERVSVAVQRTENDFDASDLLQQWDNEGDYIFAERPDELDKFTSYLKAQEADGISSVNFYFPNDLVTGAGTTNQIVIDLSGFSKGMQRFEKACKQAR